MKRIDAVKALRGTGVYLLDVFEEKIRVRMQKTNRIAMELAVVSGEVDDNYVNYLLSEAELLNDQSPKERRG